MNRTGRAICAAVVAVIASSFACTDLDPQAAVNSVAISTGLQTIQVGQAVQASAVAKNAMGGSIDGLEISWSSSNPLVATVSNTGLVTGVGAGTSDVSASVLGRSALVVLTVVQGSPLAKAISITAQPSASVASGAALAVQPAVQLRDSAGADVAQAGVIISASIASGGGTLGGTTIVSTNASGLATFGSVSITGAAGTRTLNFSAAGFPSVTSTGIDVTAGAAAALSVATQPSAAVQSAVALAQQPAVQVRDGSGNAVSQAGITVTASIASGGGTLGGSSVVATDASGVATFTNLSITGGPGDRTLSFAATSLSPTTSNAIAVSAGTSAASALTIATQPSASAQMGVSLAQQPVIQVRDGNGIAVSQAGVTVTAGIATGGGNLIGPVVIATDASGVASFTNLSITGTAGPRTLTFTSGSLSSVTSNAIAVTVPPPPPSALTIATQPSSSAQSGAAMSRQPIIQVSDASGTPVSQAGVSIAVAIATGGGTLGGNTTLVTNASGFATFTNLSITGTPGPRTLTFTSGSLTAATSGSIDITAAVVTASALSITMEPGTTQSGVAFVSQPVIQLVDGSGNPVSQAGVPVTVVIATGGGALGGTSTVATNASGVATFTNLSITGTPGPRTLNFTSGSLTPAISSSIDITGPPTLSIATQPTGTVQSGATFGQQPAVRLRDGSGNTLSQAGVSVSAAIATGGGTLGGTTTATTDAAGLASFTDLKITGIVGTRTIIFSAPAFGAVTSANITVTAGPATTLSMSAQPSASATTDVVFPSQPAVRLKDASTNNVSQSGVVVTASLATGTGTLNGTKTATTNSSGIAGFSGLSITGTGNFTLGFSASSLTSATSTQISVAAPPPLSTTQAVPSVITTQNAAMTPQTPVTASGGATPYTFAVSPALPGGVSMSPTTGQVSGTPTATLATATFTVTVTDAVTATSSKTFTLTVNAPSAGGLYPNRPASFTQSSEIDFSQPIPTGNDQIDQPIAGTDWFFIRYGTRWTKTTDANAPQSAPGIWQGHWAPGSYGGGVVGAGGGSGIGDLFTRPAGAPDRLYVSMRLYFDFNSDQWHPISNKWLNLTTDKSQILMQIKESSHFRHPEELSFTTGSWWGDSDNSPGENHLGGQLDNRAVPNKQWVQIEVLIDIPNKVYKVWQDGVLTNSLTPPFVGTEIREVGIYNFRGGGGEVITSDLYYRYDHFFIAW